MVCRLSTWERKMGMNMEEEMTPDEIRKLPLTADLSELTMQREALAQLAELVVCAKLILRTIQEYSEDHE
jgi:hypothetical protein